MKDVCDDKDLDTDPDDFDEEDIEKLRKAIAKELGIKLPAKKEALYRGNRLSGKRGRYSMLSSRSITSDEAGRK